MMAIDFPDLFGQLESIPKDAMPQEEFSLLIHHHTKLAAACAMVGDMAMGRALAESTNILIAFAMSRWPAFKAMPSEATTQSPGLNWASELPGKMESQMDTVQGSEGQDSTEQEVKEKPAPVEQEPAGDGETQGEKAPAESEDEPTKSSD